MMNETSGRARPPGHDDKPVAGPTFVAFPTLTEPAEGWTPSNRDRLVCYLWRQTVQVDMADGTQLVMPVDDIEHGMLCGGGRRVDVRDTTAIRLWWPTMPPHRCPECGQPVNVSDHGTAVLDHAAHDGGDPWADGTMPSFTKCGFRGGPTEDGWRHNEIRSPHWILADDRGALRGVVQMRPDGRWIGTGVDGTVLFDVHDQAAAEVEAVHRFRTLSSGWFGVPTDDDLTAVWQHAEAVRLGLVEDGGPAWELVGRPPGGGPEQVIVAGKVGVCRKASKQHRADGWTDLQVRRPAPRTVTDMADMWVSA